SGGRAGPSGGSTTVTDMGPVAVIRWARLRPAAPPPTTITSDVWGGSGCCGVTGPAVRCRGARGMPRRSARRVRRGAHRRWLRRARRLGRRGPRSLRVGGREAYGGRRRPRGGRTGFVRALFGGWGAVGCARTRARPGTAGPRRAPGARRPQGHGTPGRAGSVRWRPGFGGGRRPWAPPWGPSGRRRAGRVRVPSAQRITPGR